MNFCKIRVPGTVHLLYACRTCTCGRTAGEKLYGMYINISTVWPELLYERGMKAGTNVMFWTIIR